MNGTLKRLKRKLARLERKYEKTEGKPLIQARILKSAESVQKEIDRLS